MILFRRGSGHAPGPNCLGNAFPDEFHPCPGASRVLIFREQTAKIITIACTLENRSLGPLIILVLWYLSDPFVRFTTIMTKYHNLLTLMRQLLVQSVGMDSLRGT